jgi:hypothetical protein
MIRTIAMHAAALAAHWSTHPEHRRRAIGAGGTG